jgi:phosphate-selective porin OprO and OprP
MSCKTRFTSCRIIGLALVLAVAAASSFAQDATAQTESRSDQCSILNSQFPSDENWELDIGQWPDFQRSIAHIEERLDRLERPKTDVPQTTDHSRLASASLTSRSSDGFVLQSPEGDYKMQIGLLLQADGQFNLSDSNHQVVNTFSIGRLRPYVRGRFSRRFEFYFAPDFAGGNLSVQDAYIDTIFAPAFRLRAGKSKTPFGLELLHSDSNLLFFNRALSTSLAPNRDVGIQALGDISGGIVSYMVGVMNGVADGARGDVDTNDGKDVSGRVSVRLFTKTQTPLKGFGVAMAGSRGRQSGTAALPSFRTVALQQLYFSYNGVTAEGVRTRYSPQFFYYYKAFGAFGEYVHTETPIRKAGVTTNVAHEGWQLAASYVLTGEPATDAPAGVRPRSSFDFDSHHLGAFQLAARYHTLKINDRAFEFNLATPGSSRKAQAWTAGLNWILTGNLKYTFNFERTVFDGNAKGARKAENAFVFRTQLYF